MGESRAGRDGSGGRGSTGAAGDGPAVGICVLCGDTFAPGEGDDLEAASFDHFGAVHRSAEPLYAVSGGDPGGE